VISLVIFKKCLRLGNVAAVEFITFDSKIAVDSVYVIGERLLAWTFLVTLLAFNNICFCQFLMDALMSLQKLPILRHIFAFITLQREIGMDVRFMFMQCSFGGTFSITHITFQLHSSMTLHVLKKLKLGSEASWTNFAFEFLLLLVVFNMLTNLIKPCTSHRTQITDERLKI